MQTGISQNSTEPVRETTAGAAEKTDIATVEKKVLEHLTEKYGCSFECYGRSAPTLLDKSYNFVMISREKEFDGEKFHAGYREDTREFRDNYWGILARGKVDELAAPYLPDGAKVFSDPNAGYYPETLTRTSSLEDALPLEVNLYVFSAEQIDTDRLKNALKDKGIRGTMMVYLVGGEVLGQLDYTTYSDTIKQIILGGTDGSEQASVIIK